MWKPAERLRITKSQRAQVEGWMASPTTQQRVAHRSRIVLLAANGAANHAIAEEVGVSRPTVLLWRRRFEQEGPEGLLRDRPRGSGKPPLPEEKIEAVVEATLHTLAYGLVLRRIGYRDPETGKHYFFLTNAMDLAAFTVAEVYRERWQIELFFKWIKQNLRIKAFLGTSTNAVLTQLWVALCVYLLVAYTRFMAAAGWSMRQILRLLQLNLFERRSLAELLEPPERKPPDPPPQLLLQIR